MAVSRKGMRAIALAAVVVAACLYGCRSANIEKGNTCLSLGDYPSAIEFFSSELRNNPRDYDARVGLGKAYLQKGADSPSDTASWKTALIHLEAARTIRPDTAATLLLSEAWAAHSEQLLARADTVGGLEALSSALQYDPDDAELVNKAGILYFRLGHARQAEALFAKAIALDSTHAHAHFNLGMVHWARNDYAGARAHWLVALAAQPDDQDMLYWFALAQKKVREGE